MDTQREHRTDKLNDVEETDRAKEEDNEVLCGDCLSKAAEDDWTVDIDRETDRENEEFYVRCAGCEREIEFGYSHPERGGRIWPVECSDFNPWKCWPEARYYNNWLKHGWIRPDFR